MKLMQRLLYTNIFETETETFFETKIFETDTDTLKKMGNASVPGNLGTRYHTLTKIVQFL